MELENISIENYLSILKADKDKELMNQINEELNKSLGSFGSGLDLSLFMQQKDLLINQCKLAILILERDEIRAKIYSDRIDKLRKDIDSKTKKVVEITPYKSFIAWIIAVEKFLAFPIDKKNDLLYFSEATKQMMNFYESQKQ